MDRRILLRSLFAATGAAALISPPKRGEAASIFDELSAVGRPPLLVDRGSLRPAGSGLSLTTDGAPRRAQGVPQISGRSSHKTPEKRDRRPTENRVGHRPA